MKRILVVVSVLIFPFVAVAPALADCGWQSGCCLACDDLNITEEVQGTNVVYRAIRGCRAALEGETGGTSCNASAEYYFNHYPTLAEQQSIQCYFVPSCTTYHPPSCEPNCTEDVGDNCGGQCSPIVLNLQNGPWRFSGVDDPVTFDLDADGTLDRLTWTARGSAVAFLAIDHGLDGIIASGAELFGNRPGTFANGFETLKVYDSNGDGLIDHNDSVWPFLRLWTDVSHDGVSQAGEVQTLDAAGVQGLSLAYHETARADRDGNEFRQQAIYWRNGQVRPYYDVWLARVGP